MSTNTSSDESTWWDSAKRLLFYAVIIAVAIWLFNISTQARSLARANSETVNVPIFQMTAVPGGPMRFSEVFNGALEARADQAEVDPSEVLSRDPSEYLWMTFVVRNVGEHTATNLELDLNTTAPIQQALFAPPGWINEAQAEYETGAQTATVSFESLGSGDQALLFVAMNPNAFEEPYTDETRRQWIRNFEVYFEQVEVNSDEAQDQLYGHGYVTPPEESEGES